MPCHVAGCKFLTTSNAGLKNHLRTHAPELRARRRREQARIREREIHQNADNLAPHDLNLHEEDHLDDDDTDDDQADERRNPSIPQRDADRSAPEDIQYHPIINGTCKLCMSLCKYQLFSRPPL